MSDNTSDAPPPAPNQDDPAPQAPKSGSMSMGAFFGALALYAVYVLGTMAQGPYAWSATFLSIPAPFIPIALYLAVAIVLAVRRRTSRLGTGLLIGLGAFLLLGGGLCVTFLAQVRA
jgi:Ca2+/Na+ antiporter